MLFILIFPGTAWAVRIDGRFWDWYQVKTFFACPPRHLARDRVGLDMQKIKMVLGSKYLYIYVEGVSVTGLKPDKGEGAENSSIRISFKSAQSPLNRVRVAADPAEPYIVKLSYPSVSSKDYGSKVNKYWALGRFGKKYCFEIKVPIFHTKKGIHAGVSGGPLIKLAEDYEVKREHLADVLINTVDTRTHRLVDTVEFPIKKGDL